MIKKILKFIAWIFGGLIGLFLLIWVLLQIPAVQNKIVQQVTKSLSTTLDTEVSIDRVSIKFFKTVLLQGIYIESQQQDTLIYAKEISANIGVLNLFDSEIHVNSVRLDGAKVNLYRSQTDSIFNYQFLIDAFAPTDTTPVDTTAAAWTFGIDEVKVRDTYFRMLDEYAYSDMELELEDFEVQISGMDLEEFLLDINLVRMEDSKFRYSILESDQTKAVVDTTVATTTEPLAFPDFGWKFYLNRLSLNRNEIIYEDRNRKKIENAVDFSHLNLSDVALELRDWQMTPERIQGDIKKLSLVDQSGFELSRFGTNLKMTPQEIEVADFQIKTPKSNIQANATATYSEFSDLMDDLETGVRLNLDIKRSNLAFQDLEYLAPSITEIKQLNTDLDESIRLDGSLSGTLNKMNNVRLNLSVGNEVILKANGSASNLIDPENLAYNIQLRELSTSYRKLERLTQDVEIPPALNDFGQFRLTGNFQGGLNAVQGQNIRLITDAYTGFRGDLKIRHLTDGRPIAFDLDIIEMTTEADDLNGFVEGGLPPEVARLGKIQYSGKLSGDVYDLLSQGVLKTDAGDVNLDANIQFNKNYTDASYEGKIKLDQFELGNVLQDTTIGNVSLELSGKGSGISPDSLNVQIDGVVSSFNYQGYQYQNLEVDGIVNQQQFTGEASLKDPNITFDFTGDVNLNDSLPDLQFVASIDTINLLNLNFNSIPYAFSGDIEANFRGNNLDNLDGTAKIENIYLANDSAFVKTDSIVLFAGNIAKGKQLKLRSEFFNILMEGDYSLTDLPTILTNFINDYFPVDQILSPMDAPQELAIEPNEPASQLPDQSFTATFELANPVPLVSIFVAGLEQLDTAFAIVRLDTKAKDLEINATIPKFVFQGNAITNIILQSQGTPALFESVLSMEDIDYGGTKPISKAQLNLTLGNDSLGIRLNAQEENEDSTFNKIALGGRATQLDRNYRFVFDELFILNNENWSIPANNEVLYRSDFLDVNNFSINKGEQQLFVRADDKARDNDLAPLQVGFKNFQFEEIFKLINLTDAFYSGNINGTVTVRDYNSDNLNYLADMSIEDIFLEEQEVGDLIIKAEQEGQNPFINILAELKGKQSDFDVKGVYGIEDQSIDLAANVESFKLAFIDPFMMGLIDESRGTLTGNFNITGTALAPNILGALQLDSISTILGLSKVRYIVDQEEIKVNNQTMDFGQFQLVDEKGNQATLSGTMNFADFTNIGMDLNFRTNRFQVLNTTSKDVELYYGKLMVSADVDINGTTLNPIIDVDAKTLTPTQLYVQPLSIEEAVGGEENYIIFANPSEYLGEDTTRTLNDVYQVNQAGVQMTMNLEVTDDAELQIIIDPATGDKLVVRGNAEMTVDMNPAGVVKTLGNYKITNGNYSLNYQGILKKEFKIRPGSRLDFVGDPLNTRFDITAIYTAQTPTFELIRNRVTDENSPEAMAAKRRTDVNVLLNMRGDLNEPEISFDIQVPEGSNGVTSYVTQELQRLRDNPNELNKQVFSLLLLNSFVSEQSGGGGLAGTGTSVALSSVSSLLTNQLNRLADNYIKGVDINIGIDSYQSNYDLGDEGSTVTELNLGVSKNLFNDRVSVQVGGSANVNSQSALVVEGAGFSSIAGDFVLEYKVTEDGRYRLRVFRRENTNDILNQGYNAQTGVGFSFRKSFGDVNKEDKDSSGKSEKKKKEAILKEEE